MILLLKFVKCTKLRKNYGFTFQTFTPNSPLKHDINHNKKLIQILTLHFANYINFINQFKNEKTHYCI